MIRLLEFSFEIQVPLLFILSLKAGQEKFKSLINLYCHDASAVFLVFDITSNFYNLIFNRNRNTLKYRIMI